MANTRFISQNRIRICQAVLSGGLLTAAFPKIGLDGIAWVALIPLLIAVRGEGAAGRFRLGFVAGLAHFMTLLYWLTGTMQNYGNLPIFLSIPILFLFASYLALFPALFAVSAGPVLDRPRFALLMVPLFWVAFEYLRGLIFTGFPWELIGYALYRRVSLIQIVDLFGVYGISFLVAMGNAAFFLLFDSLRRKKEGGTGRWLQASAGPPLVFLLTLFLVWGYGHWRLEEIEKRADRAPSVRVSVVQGNIPQSMKWVAAHQADTVRKYVNLSLSARPERPDLVVWPETATPFYFFHQARLADMVREGIREAGTDFVFGSPSFLRQEDRFTYFNSAYLVTADGRIADRYDKVHLVPFGEYVPLKRWLPFLGKIVEHVGDFEAGKEGNTVNWRKGRLGVQICYEIIFPSLSRAMAANGAALLINLTNDAWYGRSSAPFQHFSMAVFRAVENRRGLVRAANTGISGFISPAGRVLGATDLFEDAVMTRQLPLLTESTLYTRFGDVFALACLIGTLFYLLFLRYRAVRPGNG